MADDRLADIRARVEPWLAVCPSCDAGLPASCVCPVGDPRNVIAYLLAEVERLLGAIWDYFAVADNLTPQDYGDHSGMSWDDAGKWDAAEDALREAWGKRG